jgi:hypothetical protein
MKHPEITSHFWIRTLPVKMVLCQLTYTTNRQINISTCPHRVVILNSAQKVFRTAKLSESEYQDGWFFEDFAQLWVFLYDCPVLTNDVGKITQRRMVYDDK